MAAWFEQITPQSIETYTPEQLLDCVEFIHKATQER